MSGWISSKLKVAETLLQQIDQQAAESLRKNEDDASTSPSLLPLQTSRSDTDNSNNNNNNKSKTSTTSILPLKKKKPQAHTPTLTGPVSYKNEVVSNNVNPRTSNNKIRKSNVNDDNKDKASSNVSLTDTDWTEMLTASPNPNVSASASVGASASVLRKKTAAARSGSNLLSLDARKPKTISKTKTDDVVDEKIGESSGVVDGTEKKEVSDVEKDKNMVTVKDGEVVVVREEKEVKEARKEEEESGSESETDSDASSDSESEREREERRKRREEVLAQKAAAKAIEAIKDAENLVARLEGEKQTLDKIIQERAKTQAHEASELQMTMMETMEAVDLEKQKHNSTRMEALLKLAKLETTNAELAKSLATAQWSLEQEVKRVAELHRQIELKEGSREELKSENRSHPSVNKLRASRGVEFEYEILEAEHTFVTDKVSEQQQKAKTLETNIEVTRKEIENPTEVEVALKRRLSQLTDHLIQKQAQVEALSSEKAMLMFRIEAVSRSLDESKSSVNIPINDLESEGIWEVSNSKFQDKLQKGKKHIGSLVRQLDSIFSTGAAFVRRNPTARIWSFVYFVCLHFWVLYIFRSHTAVSDDAGSGSGAAISLENINTGV